RRRGRRGGAGRGGGAAQDHPVGGGGLVGGAPPRVTRQRRDPGPHPGARPRPGARPLARRGQRDHLERSRGHRGPHSPAGPPAPPRPPPAGPPPPAMTKTTALLLALVLAAPLALGCAHSIPYGAVAFRVESNVPDATVWVDDVMIGKVSDWAGDERHIRA